MSQNFLDWICLEIGIIEILNLEKFICCLIKIEMLNQIPVFPLKQIWKEMKKEKQNQLNSIMNFNDEKRQFIFLISIKNVVLKMKKFALFD